MTFLENLNDKYFKNQDSEVVDSSVINFYNFLKNFKRPRAATMSYSDNLFLEEITDEYLDSVIDSIKSRSFKKEAGDPNLSLSEIFDGFISENAPTVVDSFNIFNNLNSMLTSYNRFYTKADHIRLNRYV